MHIRQVRLPEDVTALDALITVVEECDGHRPIGEHKYLSLLHGDPEETVGLVMETPSRELVGYAALSEFPDATWGLELAMHPLHRSKEDFDVMIAAAVDLCAGKGGARIRAWAFQPRLSAELEAAGFVPERELRQLRIPLPTDENPRFPPSVEVRAFRPGTDESTWLAVNNAAFEGHPENGEWTHDIIADRRRQDWWDPEGFRMAWEGGRLVGSCWTKVHEGDVGEIYIISVAPEEQGRGLGRALVLEGLRYLCEERGCAEGMLYVDASNRAAIALYEDMGFGLDHVDRSFIRPL